jgi:cytochrome P450
MDLLSVLDPTRFLLQIQLLSKESTVRISLAKQIVHRTIANLTQGAGSKFRKSSWYGVVQGHRKFDLFAEQNESVHGAQRRLVSRIYSLDNLKSLEPYVNETISHFVGKMHDLQGSRVDMGKWMQLFAFGTADSTLI